MGPRPPICAGAQVKPLLQLSPNAVSGLVAVRAGHPVDPAMVPVGLDACDKASDPVRKKAS